MARSYLIVIIVGAIFGTMISSPESRPPSSADDAFAQSASGADESGDSSAASSEPASSGSGREVRLERSSDGHFYADVEINGASVRALIDTGASGIALSREDARRAGLATSIGMTEVVGKGADGDVRGEFVSLDTVSLGPKTAEDMTAVVLNSGDMTLLGQSFLGKFDSVRIEGDRMILR